MATEAAIFRVYPFSPVHSHKHLLSDAMGIKFRKLPSFIRLLNRFRSN